MLENMTNEELKERAALLERIKALQDECDLSEDALVKSEELADTLARVLDLQLRNAMSTQFSIERRDENGWSESACWDEGPMRFGSRWVAWGVVEDLAGNTGRSIEDYRVIQVPPERVDLTLQLVAVRVDRSIDAAGWWNTLRSRYPWIAEILTNRDRVAIRADVLETLRMLPLTPGEDFPLLANPHEAIGQTTVINRLE